MAKRKRKATVRIFIDSSVLIAATISPIGSAREVIKQGFSKKIILYVSDLVLEETERNLQLKSPHSLNYFYKFHDSLIATVVNPTKNQIIQAIKFIEPKDAPIVAGAMLSEADYLVSFDKKHLLQHKKEIEENFKVKVVTPDEVIK